MILESALADALYLNWAIPVAALPPAPPGLSYDLGGAREGSDSSETFFSLVLFRQVGLHLRGASWLALSYPQVNARLYVRDAANTASVLLLRQLVPGWVVPIGRLVGGQPLSAAVCEFPEVLPRELPVERAGDAAPDPRVLRWSFSAGARLGVSVRLGGAPGSAASGEPAWEQEVAFFRDRSRAFWRRGDNLRRVETEVPPAIALPVRAELVQTGWLETFLPFAPVQDWAVLRSAFLVPRVQLVFAFDPARDMPVAAPMAAAG
ncbi:MAG: DUF2071 domain-containing protein [Thermoanaerobaculia bacterium]